MHITCKSMPLYDCSSVIVMAQIATGENWQAVTPALAELKTEYMRCLEKGRILHNQLKEWADTTKVYPESSNLYHVEQGDVKDLPKDIEDELRRRDIRGQFTWVEVKNLGKKAKDGDAIYSNKTDAWHGAIIHTENIKERDTNPKQKQFFCSEIVWQSYLISCTKFQINPGLLRILVQEHIVNEETKMVIWQAARAEDKHRKTQKPTDENGYRVYEEPQDGFYALLGSPLGVQMLHLLLDHKSEVGFRYVKEVVLFAMEKEAATLDWERARTMMIVLSHPYANRSCKK